MPNEIYHRSEWGNPKADGFGDVYFDASATNKLYNHSDYYENSDGTDKILRDIPNKASIVLTPTAYSDGSLNTVIPPYQVLPQELVTNGTFDTDSDWTKDAGWTISNGEANCDGVGINSLQQSGITTTGKIYKLTFDIISKSNNSFLIISTNFGDTYISGSSTGLGTNTFYIQPTNGTGIRFRVANGTTLSIDNVSVKEVQEADFDFSRASVATRVNEKGLIEDVASGIPRIDYTSGQGALLLEPQRTNSFLQSNQFDTTWILDQVTVTAGQTGVGGSTDAWLLTATSGTGEKRIRQSSPLSGNVAVSVYAKKGTNNYLWLRGVTNGFAIVTWFDLGNGTVATDNAVSSEMIDMGNGWYRCIAVFNQDAGWDFHIGNSNQDNQRSVNTTGTIYIQYSQSESGSYATSYIPTEGSTVTRSAETANNSGNADLFNDSEGVLYAQIADFDNDSFRQLTVSDGSASNRVSIMNTTTENQVVCFVNVGGVTQASISTILHSTHQFNRIAIKYKANDFSVYINGFEIGTDTSGTVPTGLNTLNFDNGAGSADVYGNTKELAVFKEALTDAELESLTSWISFVEMATDLEYTIE